MIEILRAFDYRPPVIVPGQYGRLEIRQDPHRCYFIHVDGEKWMVYNHANHEQAYEVYSHYRLARGHVMVTGMGFGARENWILTRPEVTRLTVVEKNPEIIQYHRDINSPFLRDPRVEIIQHDAQTLTASCDVLLADHFETESFADIIERMKIVQQNISCEHMWFWPLERIIMHARRWYTTQDRSLVSKFQAYCRLRQDHSLDRLPDLTPEQLDMLVMMHSSYLFSSSDILLSQNWPDPQENFEIWGRI